MLYDSIRLDSAANIRIRHYKSRFKSYIPNSHRVLVGRGSAEMLGTGDINITVQHTERERKVTAQTSLLI